VKNEERYAKQILCERIGERGHAAIRRAKAVVIGCGALGCSISSCLARAGVGTIKIVDGDCVELGNLHRQFLYDEADARQGKPKALAAADHLREANSDINIIPEAVRVTAENIESIIEDFDIILDGTDNMETRFLINDAALKNGKPWVHGAVAGTVGMTMTIAPEKTACLRCLMEEPPPSGSVPTADTIGIINSLPVMVGAMEALEALKVLVSPEEVRSQLLYFDAWERTFKTIEVPRRDDCPACARRKFEFLSPATK